MRACCISIFTCEIDGIHTNSDLYWIYHNARNLTGLVSHAKILGILSFYGNSYVECLFINHTMGPFWLWSYIDMRQPLVVFYRGPLGVGLTVEI